MQFPCKLLFAVVLTFGIATVRPCFGDPLSIGIILPLTGPASGNTRFGSDGIEFAQTRNQVSSTLKFFTEDYGSEPARAVTAYKKLADVNHVHVFLVFGSPAAMALKPLVERDKNVMLAIASAQGLTTPGGNSFRLVNSALEDAKFIAQRWFAGGGQSLSVVHVDDDYGESYLQGLKSALPQEAAAGMHVFSFLPKETDFKPIIGQLRAKQPSIVVLAAFAQPAGLFLRQARELNFKSKFICPLACYNPDLFTVGQGGEEDLIVLTPANPQDQTLVEEFRKHFHYDGNFMSWGFYDGLMMLAELSSRCAVSPAMSPAMSPAASPAGASSGSPAGGEAEAGSCFKQNLRRSEGFATSRGQLAFDDKGEMSFQITVNRTNGGKFIPERVD